MIVQIIEFQKTENRLLLTLYSTRLFKKHLRNRELPLDIIKGKFCAIQFVQNEITSIRFLFNLNEKDIKCDSDSDDVEELVSAMEQLLTTPQKPKKYTEESDSDGFSSDTSLVDHMFGLTMNKL